MKEEVKQAIAELQAPSIEPVPMVSFTVQVPKDMADRFEKLARLTGHIRSLPKSDDIVGNMSYSCREAGNFLFAHLDMYQAEKAEELSKALES